MPGGYELTDMDVLKLQKMYGCDGACGGWAKSEDGGFSNEIIVLIFCMMEDSIVTVKNEKS